MVTNLHLSSPPSPPSPVPGPHCPPGEAAQVHTVLRKVGEREASETGRAVEGREGPCPGYLLSLLPPRPLPCQAWVFQLLLERGALGMLHLAAGSPGCSGVGVGHFCPVSTHAFIQPTWMCTRHSGLQLLVAQKQVVSSPAPSLVEVLDTEMVPHGCSAQSCRHQMSRPACGSFQSPPSHILRALSPKQSHPPVTLSLTHCLSALQASEHMAACSGGCHICLTLPGCGLWVPGLKCVTRYCLTVLNVSLLIFEMGRALPRGIERRAGALWGDAPEGVQEELSKH